MIHYVCPAEWRDKPMPLLDDLALFLGGSSTSFTGELLHLMRRADPGNRAALARAFPGIDTALRAWETLDDNGVTYGQLFEHLTQREPDPPQHLQLDLLTALLRIEQLHAEPWFDSNHWLWERIVTCDLPRLKAWLEPETQAWRNRMAETISPGG